MKKLIALSLIISTGIISTGVAFENYGSTCPGGDAITVKNDAQNPIEVFIVHPKFCGQRSEMDELSSTLFALKLDRNRFENEIHDEELKFLGADFVLINNDKESLEKINKEITAVEKQIAALKQKQEDARKTGQKIEPNYVCKSFSVQPGHSGSEKQFTRTFASSWLARSYEVHVYDEGLKTMRVSTYVKPGCILTYPNDFTQGI